MGFVGGLLTGNSFFSNAAPALHWCFVKRFKSNIAYVWHVAAEWTQSLTFLSCVMLITSKKNFPALSIISTNWENGSFSTISFMLKNWKVYSLFPVLLWWKAVKELWNAQQAESRNEKSYFADLSCKHVLFTVNRFSIRSQRTLLVSCKFPCRLKFYNSFA